MSRTVIVPFAALLLLAVAPDAHAQDTQETQETHAKPSVRVHVGLDRARDVANVLVERRGSWITACEAPCTVEAAPGEEIRIDMGDILDAPLSFVVAADGRTDQDIIVVRRGKGLFVGGLVAIGVGAISLALGAAILRGAGPDDLFGDNGTNKFVGRLAALLGAGSVAAGTVMIVRRSTTPYLVSPALPERPTPSMPPAPPIGVSLVWSMRF